MGDKENGVLGIATRPSLHKTPKQFSHRQAFPGASQRLAPLLLSDGPEPFKCPVRIEAFLKPWNLSNVDVVIGHFKDVRGCLLSLPRREDMDWRRDHPYAADLDGPDDPPLSEQGPHPLRRDPQFLRRIRR